MVCDYQEQEYKIAINSINESNITELGPFYHRGPGTVHHDITSLIRDEEYSLQVTVFAYLNSTVSCNVSFGKVVVIIKLKLVTIVLLHRYWL